MSGALYICGLPIGNMEDISPRTVNVLRSVDYVACEDTRKAALNLKGLQINRPFISYHDHSSDKRLEQIVSYLKEGKNVALISDAGMPLISDPGYHLVKAALEENMPVYTVPGPTALIAALVLSGLPTDRFAFEGFLKPKSSARIKQLQALQEEQRTMVFYESPHRIVKTLGDMLRIFGDRKAFLAREITKKYEEHYSGTIAQILNKVQGKLPRGEIVLVITGRSS